MTEKKRTLGICDHCGEEMPRWRRYTSKGKPRLYCSRKCRNTANSRAGAKVRSRKIRQRMARGEWVNPVEIRPPTPEEQAERARKGRKREVAERRWRNPALSDEARRKLSRPRKHFGILHQALEKLRYGSVADLTEEEAEAHRAYRRKLRRARRDEVNAWYRRWYRARKQRAKGD